MFISPKPRFIYTVVAGFTTTYAISASKAMNANPTDGVYSSLPVISSANETDRHDITEILLKVACMFENENRDHL
jgi:hypothetical protein